MINKNNTLVILTPGFPESERDSTCLPMQQSFIRSLKDNYPGSKIIVLSFQYPYYEKKYNWFDIPVMSFNGKNKGGLTRLLLRRKVLAVLQEIRRRNNITGILSFWLGECAWVGKRFGDKYGIKHYCWILGQDAKKENKYPKRIKPGGADLIALSDFIQDEFEKNHGTRPQYVIPPGINAKQFNNPVKEKDIDIIAAGSLIPLKQYELFVEVIAGIKKQVTGIKAMLIGDGPEKKKLQTLITAYGLESNITLAGELPHPEVLQCMQRAKIFLHPSSYEGFGVVCIEALYAGCHVISFCKPMYRDIEHWHIVKSKDEMLGKVLDILQNHDTAYKQVIPFEMNDTVKKMMGLFL
jgi:glycosyltransferase involved in cell wall biosynthesis